MREERKESIEEVEGIHKCLETTKEEILNKRKAAAKIMFKMLKVDCRNYGEVKERISQLIQKERWENSEYDIPYSILMEVSKLLDEEMFSLPCNAKSELKNEERLTKEQRDLLEAIETTILEGMGTKKIAGITMEYVNEDEKQLTNNEEVKDIRERSFNSAREGEIIILPNERIKLSFGKVKEKEGIKGIELKIESF